MSRGSSRDAVESHRGDSWPMLDYLPAHASPMAVCRKVGLKEVKLHDLRRTWISRTLARGVGAFIVKDLVGHEHITTTQRYVNLDMRALEKAVRP